MMSRIGVSKVLWAGLCATLIGVAALTARAQAPTETENPAASETAPMRSDTPSAESAGPTVGNEGRSTSGFHANLIFSPVETWVPGKIGLAAGYSVSDRHSFDLEYTGASINTGLLGINLGELSEKRIAVVYRRFFGRSFNLIIGASYNQFQVGLGSKQLADVTSDERAHVDLFQFSNIGLEFGLSNRFHPFHENFIFQVDWVGFNIPVSTLDRKSGIIDATSNQDVRDDFEKVLDLLSGVPRFYLLKLAAGWSF